MIMNTNSRLSDLFRRLPLQTMSEFSFVSTLEDNDLEIAFLTYDFFSSFAVCQIQPPSVTCQSK